MNPSALSKILSKLKVNIKMRRTVEFLIKYVPLSLLVILKGNLLKKYTKGPQGEKLTLLTAYDERFKTLGDISSSQIIKYCEYHGFGYQIFKIDNLTKRPYSWMKILLMAYLIRQDIKMCNDWFLWVDADAVIVKLNYDIVNEIIDKVPPETAIIISKDLNGINAGVVIFKHDKFTEKLLGKIWSMNQYIFHEWWEQAALIELIDQNWADLQQKVFYVPQRILNAYTYELYNQSNPDGELCAESFIYHVPGRPLAERIQRIQRVISAK
jgi:hypothetical protein